MSCSHVFNRQLFTLLITIVHPLEYKDSSLQSNLEIVIEKLTTAKFITQSISRYGMQTIHSSESFKLHDNLIIITQLMIDRRL